MSFEKEHILVIRLGALGDIVFCFQAFHQIRQAHPGAEIALLTRPAFAPFAQTLPWFDRVIIETHPTAASPLRWLDLRKKIRDFNPSLVYDLQGKTRQTILYLLLGGPFGPPWSGAAPFCKFPRPWPPAPGMGFADFLGAQLRAAGVPYLPPPNLPWLDAPTAKFDLPQRYAVLIPGCSPNALHKRWPAPKYAALAKKLIENRVACVLVGSDADADAAADIQASAPETLNLCGKTSLFELAGVLRRAVLAIGNDTGPLHMAAVLKTPSVILFSGKSDPVWSCPPGSHVAWRQSTDLADLSVANVVSAIDEL